MRNRVKAPIDQGLRVVGSGAGIERGISGYNTDVSIVDLVECSSFDNSDAEGRVSGESGSNGQACGTTSNDDIVEGSIARYTK